MYPVNKNYSKMVYKDNKYKISCRILSIIDEVQDILKYIDINGTTI